MSCSKTMRLEGCGKKKINVGRTRLEEEGHNDKHSNYEEEPKKKRPLGRPRQDGKIVRREILKQLTW